MWERFKRAMRSFAGLFVSSLENPELILEQNIRDLNDQVPKMNENIAMVRANVTLLEKENAKYKTEIAQLTTKVKAAIQAGRDDIAAQYAGKLQMEKDALIRNEAQLATARAAYEKALTVKKAFIKEKERKTQEAQNALQEAQRAKWQAKVADSLESFQVAGIDSTHDEMIRKVTEQSAVNQARLEMALDSVDTAGMKIEEDAQTIHANELVRQMKLEMGLLSPEPVAAVPVSTPVSEPVAESAKTIGKKVGEFDAS
ncbi:MAG: PspA/IM30 family protein [Myxococcales bacterium]|jgi:phage shock protein A|nr:PspA/IM30 family protein [Myxococcales bacterium]